MQFKGLRKTLIVELDNQKCIFKCCLTGRGFENWIAYITYVFRMETEKMLVRKSGTQGKEMSTGYRSYVRIVWITCKEHHCTAPFWLNMQYLCQTQQTTDEGMTLTFNTIILSPSLTLFISEHYKRQSEYLYFQQWKHVRKIMIRKSVCSTHKHKINS